MCECELCKISQEFKKAMQSVKTPKARTVFTQLYDRLSHLEFDVNYTNANLDGSWPSSPFKDSKLNLKHLIVSSTPWKRVYKHKRK